MHGRDRRQDVRTRATEEPSPLATCSSAVEALMRTLSESGDGRLDSIVEFVPDAMIDKCLENKKASGCVQGVDAGDTAVLPVRINACVAATSHGLKAQSYVQNVPTLHDGEKGSRTR